MPRRIIMDVDTGTDDALAILYGVRHPDVEILGISCVAGNAEVEQVVINTCKVLDAAGAGDIPVAAGAAQPLIEKARREGGSHGPDGLGGIPLPDTSRQPSTMHAVDLMHQLIMASSEAVSLVTLAPKTNLALLLRIRPDVAERLEEIIFMGGSASGRNAAPVAEFNVWQDPEAAKCVIESPVPITMYGLDLFDRLVIGKADADRFRAHDHPAIRLAGELLHRRRPRSDPSNSAYRGLLGDAGAMVMLTNSQLFITEELPVRVILEGVGRGQTIVDRRARPQHQSGPEPQAWPRIRVALDLDAAKAASAFIETIRAYAA